MAFCKPPSVKSLKQLLSVLGFQIALSQFKQLKIAPQAQATTPSVLSEIITKRGRWASCRFRFRGLHSSGAFKV